MAKELRFLTDHGRAVYGGGGIVPDVFVARDTIANSSYFTHLCRRSVLRAYALAYYQHHKATLATLTPAQYQATFRLSDAELVAVGRLGQLAGLPAGAAVLRRCAPLVQHYIKAYVAQSAYGPEAARLVLREDDAELQQAMQAVKDNNALVALLHQA